MARAWLIAGSGGMLGTALQRVLGEAGVRFAAPPERDFNITDNEMVKERVAEFETSLKTGESGVLMNAAAYTNVERAEDDEGVAMAVNGLGPMYLASAARDSGLGFVHVSTDFVFDGAKEGPYAEEDDPNPLSVYGRTKLVGENAVFELYPDALVVRTAWVFGPGGVNFPAKIVSAARERGAVSVVTDEVGSPTYTVDLARGILGLVEAGAVGMYHLAGAGSCSRFELAAETLRLAGLGDIPIDPVVSSAFPSKAPRPKNSVLDCSKAAAIGVTMPEWHDALARFLLHDVGI